MREAEITRNTNETQVEVSLCLNGGACDVATGCGFLDHMLTLFAAHGNFGLMVRCAGDVEVDYHHSVEDIGIALGQAFHAALGEGRGIARYGFMILPMDEALILTSVDISGRGHLSFELPLSAQKVGDFDCELAEEFFTAFARSANVTLHIRELAGKNAHHVIEGCFKSFARSLRQAVSVDPAHADEIPSTKGVL